MWTFLLKFLASPKWFLPIAGALLIVALMGTMYLYGESSQKVKQENEVRQEYIETRKRIDENVKGVRNNDAAAARQWLLNRQGDKR